MGNTKCQDEGRG